VVSPGEYAVRGGLIDLFPMGSLVPFRVDLFDDEIDSIRTFDPDSQRSLYPVPEVRLLPGREFPMDDEARAKFRSRWREMLEGDPTKSRIYKDMGAGVATAGIEYYLPLFFDDTATVFDYLGNEATVVLHGDLEPAFQRFWQDTKDRFRLVQGDPERPALPPESLFLSIDQFYTRANRMPSCRCAPACRTWMTTRTSRSWATCRWCAVRKTRWPACTPTSATPSTACCCWPKAMAGARACSTFCAPAAEPARRSIRWPSSRATADEKVGIATAALTAGFSWIEDGIDFVTETELFAAGPTTRRRKKQEQVSDVEALIKDLAELNVGDPVVHSQHGIGRYRGLVNMDVGNKNPDGTPAMQEFLHLEYADKAVLYVPVSQLQLISRYTGVSADEAPLHKLGSGQWEKAKRKAAEQVRDSAAELLNIYARRAAREGHAFRYSPQDYETFANDFGFEETADQNAAIHAVIQDMISPRPMDRLVCGDVGFGKTEVALRAAFVAVTGGKQVAFPGAHHAAGRAALPDAGGPLQQMAGEGGRGLALSLGQGDHRRHQGHWRWHGGHRGGHAQAAQRIHQVPQPGPAHHRRGAPLWRAPQGADEALRAEVDVLTLTATPIPRTLGMALEGLRDLSVIATAPQRRLAIKTFVRNEGTGVIREAVLRELKRGGQVLLSAQRGGDHREPPPEARRNLARGAHRRGPRPDARARAGTRDARLRGPALQHPAVLDHHRDRHRRAHGQHHHHEPRRQVRPGAAAPAARARGPQPPPGVCLPDGARREGLTKQAQQRLEAIQQMEELGSGFYLAMHDLEIRGAGEVLGENQSGNMLEVGFQLYNEMLAEAVRCLKAGKEPDLLSPLSVTTDINLHAPALLPDDYCGDVHLRLSFYKKLATAKTPDQIDGLLEEIVDRFGKLPPQAQTLIDVHRLRVLSQPYGVVKVDAAPGVINITFKPQPPIDPMRIIELIQKNKHIKLAGNEKLRIERELKDPKDRAHNWCATSCAAWGSRWPSPPSDKRHALGNTAPGTLWNLKLV
jgi:transcription-repair coupling factor (superfamily II helicase)